MNISLTAIGLLWTTSDFFARGVFEDKNMVEVGKSSLMASQTSYVTCKRAGVNIQFCF